MIKKILLFIAIISINYYASAQSCKCETELNYIAGFMAKNYAGFNDKQTLMTKDGYNKLLNEYIAYSKNPNSHENCLLVISQFLSHFKDQHVSIRSNFDATKLDSAYISKRQIIPLSDKRIAELRRSTTFEGIYDFHNPASYKIAIIKDKTPLHDYIGVIVSSNLPGWKPGMVKLELKLLTDSIYTGLLYMLNQMPKVEGFVFGKDVLWGDWHREGTIPKRPAYNYVPVASKKLSDKTLYIKISSFGPSNAKNIDSILLVNKELLKTMPYLVLDLRDNNGGADYTYGPLMPYIYSNPFNNVGTSVLSTDENIKGWKKYLDDQDMSAQNKNSIKGIIQQLEIHKGEWVSVYNDAVIADYKKLVNPSKVIILINKGCASTTEQFLLFARQSKKVTLIGENTSGTLDYSNVIETPFSCMPYVLKYSSSRSRRLDKHEGIDNIGIKPDHYLSRKDDWIKKAVAFFEN